MLDARLLVSSDQAGEAVRGDGLAAVNIHEEEALYKRNRTRMLRIVGMLGLAGTLGLVGCGLEDPESWSSACARLDAAWDRCSGGLESPSYCASPGAITACSDPDELERADVDACVAAIESAPSDPENAATFCAAVCEIACTES